MLQYVIAQVFHLKYMHPFTRRYTETFGSVECVQQYSVVVADVLVEIGTAMTSADCLSTSACHR
jgi:hypothetical protein